ncbi:patatin-like phospholipase family protein [Phycicoccus sp. Root563]|uniref:patatin-like phospholipase family protein n=1 Tax=Phycicoccus sp. Root563 TaxID=1736562 RepID=UPI0009ECB63F|nr:patatin-like phospholipase family protein [Phycicoccus sp. Root563]
MSAPGNAVRGGAGRTAFVLTGGGSLGAVQVGMMTALHEHGIDPDVLVGTSVGAVNAAYLAGPGTTGQRLTSLAALWTGMRRQDVFVAEPRRWVRAAVGGAPSMFSSRPLRLLLTTHLGYEAFEGARLGLAVTATDIVTGAALLLDSGPVVDAVAASAAVPGMLPPVRRGGRTLVDGAIGHAGALAYADAHGVADIYLLPAGYPCAAPPPATALGVGLTALNLLLHRQLVQEVRAYAGPARLHIAPPLCPLATSSADFTHANTLIRRALTSTRHWLDQPAHATTIATQNAGAASVLAIHGPHHHAAPPITRAVSAPMKGTLA